jgi:glycerol uptake facilitator protein
MSPFIAEITGTALLLIMGAGVVANVVLDKTKGNGGGWIVITTGWALGVFIGVVVAGPYSGAHLNPAVSVSLAIAGKFDWNLIPVYILAQLIGASIGAILVWLMYKDHFKTSTDAGAKKAVFCTEPAIRNYPVNFLCELIGTFILILVVLYSTGAELHTPKEATPIGLGALGALPVAFLVWVIGLSLGGTTGYAINPARDLGPRIIHAILPIRNKAGSDWQYAWIPVLAPLTGGALAALFFMLLKG